MNMSPIFCYQAKDKVNFVDKSWHRAGRTYFPKKETENYFTVNGEKLYVEKIVEKITVGPRTFVGPDHEKGYTHSYLQGMMEICGFDFYSFLSENIAKKVRHEYTEFKEAVYTESEIHDFVLRKIQK